MDYLQGVEDIIDVDFLFCDDHGLSYFLYWSLSNSWKKLEYKAWDKDLSSYI